MLCNLDKWWSFSQLWAPVSFLALHRMQLTNLTVVILDLALLTEKSSGALHYCATEAKWIRNPPANGARPLSGSRRCGCRCGCRRRCRRRCCCRDDWLRTIVTRVVNVEWSYCLCVSIIKSNDTTVSNTKTHVHLIHNCATSILRRPRFECHSSSVGALSHG